MDAPFSCASISLDRGDPAMAIAKMAQPTKSPRMDMSLAMVRLSKVTLLKVKLLKLMRLNV